MSASRTLFVALISFVAMAIISLLYSMVPYPNGQSFFSRGRSSFVSKSGSWTDAVPVPATDEDGVAYGIALGSKCHAERNNTSVLSAHIVIVPFLGYNASKEEILEREKEYLHVLEKNLAHPYVQCVHILTTNFADSLERFGRVGNASKLLISKVNSTELTRHAFEYISQHLLNRTVMFVNADIYLGEGFDKVDPLIMDEQSIMYSLTRHVAEEDRCGPVRTHTDTDLCELKGWSSHDAFMFRLRKPLTENFFQELNFPEGREGSENRLMWLFQAKLHYCILNPCPVLKVYHHHCSKLRTSKTHPRVELGNGRKGITVNTRSTSLMCQVQQ